MNERYLELADDVVDQYSSNIGNKPWDEVLKGLIVGAIKKALDESKQAAIDEEKQVKVEESTELKDFEFSLEPVVVWYAQGVHLAFRYGGKFFVYRHTLKRFNEANEFNIKILTEGDPELQGFNWPSWWVDAFKTDQFGKDLIELRNITKLLDDNNIPKLHEKEDGYQLAKPMIPSERVAQLLDNYNRKLKFIIARSSAEQELQGVIHELRDKIRGLTTRCNTYEKIFEALGCKSYEDLVAAYDAVGRALGVDQGETFDKVNAELMEVESDSKEGRDDASQEVL